MSEGTPDCTKHPDGEVRGSGDRITSFAEMVRSLNTDGTEIELLIPAADSKSALAGTAAFMDSLDTPVRAVLAGPVSKIEATIDGMDAPEKFRRENITLLQADTPEEIFEGVLARIDRGKNQMILKGNITSDRLMKGLLRKKEKIIDKGKIITHLRLFETGPGMAVMSDGGINVVSNISEEENREKLLTMIRMNAVKVAEIFGSDQPEPLIPDTSANMEELKAKAARLFADPSNFPKVIQFPWIGPANILYKATAATPWPLRFDEKVELSSPGIATVFSRIDGGGPLVVAGPAKGADFEQKLDLLREVLERMPGLGIVGPKTALLDFTEQYASFPDTPSINDSRGLVEKLDGKTIAGKRAVVDGPMAFDLAVSEKAASVKKYDSRVSGKPDILFTPDFTSAVLLTELYTHMETLELPWPAADISFGSTVPIVVPSRSDSPEHKLRSITAAAYIAAHTG
jgi:phosphotransacetylase